MKAFLLAAGQGTRLRPLTDNVPKCLLPIPGKPLPGFWLDLLQQYGIDEVPVILHNHPSPLWVPFYFTFVNAALGLAWLRWPARKYDYAWQRTERLPDAN